MDQEGNSNLMPNPCSFCTPKSLEEQDLAEPKSDNIRTFCETCKPLISQSMHAKLFKEFNNYLSDNDVHFKEFSINIKLPLVLYAKIISENKPEDKEVVYRRLYFIKKSLKEEYGNFIEENFGKKHSQDVSFEISIEFKHKNDDQLYDNLAFSRKNWESFVFDVSKQNLEKLLLALNATDDYDVKLECGHKQIYITGRYTKLSRKISQSPWTVDSEYKPDTSIEELIVKGLKNYIQCDATFSASGREDIDVRMLGRGRPFIIKCGSPSTTYINDHTLASIRKAINSYSEAVNVSQLFCVTSLAMKYLQEIGESKKKSYSATIITDRSLNNQDFKAISNIHDLKIQQWTPIRVAHRRSLLNRRRTIYSAKLEPTDCDRAYRLCLITEAGTYIKEFVHGDFGRTKPNMSTLLNCMADIIELDVEDIDIDWPPQHTILYQ